MSGLAPESRQPRTPSILRSDKDRQLEYKRNRGEMSCAECRRYALSCLFDPLAYQERFTPSKRLKLKCDKKVCSFHRLALSVYHASLRLYRSPALLAFVDNVKLFAQTVRSSVSI